MATVALLGAGTASAAVWQCGREWDFCTTVVYDTGVYDWIYGNYMYTVSRGSVWRLNCYGGSDDQKVWYNGKPDGWANGWVLGDALATGRDPNSLISPCI